MNSLDNIPPFTKDDYLHGTAPFEFVLSFENKFKQEQAKQTIKELAKSVGVGNFVTLFKSYQQIINSQKGVDNDMYTNFDGQELELKCGQWVCDEYGVTLSSQYGFDIEACNHAIMPVQRLINIDTGIEKLKISFKKGRIWRSIIVDKETLASATRIIGLANYGIAVNSENARYLVKYFTDIENLNYDALEELNSVSRLGWIEDYGFSPYVENLVFDGDLSFKSFYDSVSQRGEFQKWIDLCKEIRQSGTIAKIALAASFASVLVEPCGCLPFFVHLWGGTEAGKTVALMLAASVWADPSLGKYIHTFNSTAVAQELAAGFVNSLPLCLDELQIQKDRKDFDVLIYQLSEGVGRVRGQKTGGLQKTPTWRNCILTTGEYPISNTKSGGGVINRILEIDCKDEKLFANPKKTVDILKKNYGIAGMLFVDWLQKDNHMQEMQQCQKDMYRVTEQMDTTEKQAMACSVVLTADKLITDLFFDGENGLCAEDIAPFLSTKDEVSQNERAYEFLLDFVNINANRFSVNSFGEYAGEVWGKDDENEVYIIKSKFDQIMGDNGFNATAFLSWAKRRDMIRCSDSRNTIAARVRGKAARCICLKKPIEINFQTDLETDSPVF